jgi:hypothetical protein
MQNDWIEKTQYSLILRQERYRNYIILIILKGPDSDMGTRK